MENVNLGSKIRELRKKKGFVTYQDLIEHLGINPDTECNPYRLYVGHWDAYEKWAREAAVDIYRTFRKVDKKYAAVCIAKGRYSEEGEALFNERSSLEKMLEQIDEALDDKNQFEETED